MSEIGISLLRGISMISPNRSVGAVTQVVHQKMNFGLNSTPHQEYNHPDVQVFAK